MSHFACVLYFLTNKRTIYLSIQQARAREVLLFHGVCCAVEWARGGDGADRQPSTPWPTPHGGGEVGRGKWLKVEAGGETALQATGERAGGIESRRGRWEELWDVFPFLGLFPFSRACLSPFLGLVPFSVTRSIFTDLFPFLGRVPFSGTCSLFWDFFPFLGLVCPPF